MRHLWQLIPWWVKLFVWTVLVIRVYRCPHCQSDEPLVHHAK